MQLVPSEQHCEDPQVCVPEPARVAEAHHLAARLVFRRHRSPQKQREKGGHPVLEVRTFFLVIASQAFVSVVTKSLNWTLTSEYQYKVAPCMLLVLKIAFS